MPHLLTRRTFNRMAATGVALAALPLRAAGRLRVGIGTYSYHNLSLDEMIEQLKALQVGEIEMSRGEFMLMNHPAEEMFHSARTTLDQAGIRSWCYYAATIKEDQDLEGALRSGGLLGVRNIPGDATEDILHRIDHRAT